MNFKEQLQKDLAVFLNPAEFGELIEIEGQIVNVIVEDILLEYPNALTDGLRQRRKRVSLAQADAPDMLEIGRVLTLAGDEWIIEAMVEEMGMVTLTLCREVF